MRRDQPPAVDQLDDDEEAAVHRDASVRGLIGANPVTERVGVEDLELGQRVDVAACRDAAIPVRLPTPFTGPLYFYWMGTAPAGVAPCVTAMGEVEWKTTPLSFVAKCRAPEGSASIGFADTK